MHFVAKFNNYTNELHIILKKCFKNSIKNYYSSISFLLNEQVNNYLFKTMELFLSIYSLFAFLYNVINSTIDIFY